MSAGPSDRRRLTVAAVHVLTAAYSVVTGISLTSEDVVAIEREGSRIDPGAWRRTTDLLERADRGGPGRGLAIALDSFVLRCGSGSPTRGSSSRRSAVGSPRP